LENSKKKSGLEQSKSGISGTGKIFRFIKDIIEESKRNVSQLIFMMQHP
jgi:hypothetical protein